MRYSEIRDVFIGPREKHTTKKVLLVDFRATRYTFERLTGSYPHTPAMDVMKSQLDHMAGEFDAIFEVKADPNRPWNPLFNAGFPDYKVSA